MLRANVGPLFVDLALGDLGRPLFLTLFGILTFLLIVARFEHALATFSGDGESPARSKTNCPGCGARTPAESDRCSHCERSLTDDDEAPDYGRVES